VEEQVTILAAMERVQNIMGNHIFTGEGTEQEQAMAQEMFESPHYIIQLRSDYLRARDRFIQITRQQPSNENDMAGPDELNSMIHDFFTNVRNYFDLQTPKQSPQFRVQVLV
jgi:hypothetical protein